MAPDKWERVEALFGELLPLAPADQARGIAAVADAEVREELASLLQHTGSGGVDEVIARAAAMATGTTIDSLHEPERLANYRLTRRLGHGGMGAVYEAIREDLNKRVAIKLIRHEFDTEAARARFQQERLLLAGLEHPYIARLLDGGETPAGAPYLVMDYIDGRPIDQVCPALAHRQRIGLFLKVCEAVQYAHQHLVVHRDLKPANILVNAQGEPRVIDFGIAKLMDESGTAGTQTGLMALTPDYASPEQVMGRRTGTASDVYSLGVILYEIMSRRKPYRLESNSLAELDRVICRTPPDPPRLGDELGAIVLMAMRKEPERRYASVEAFAADLRRYLDGFPVKARPDTVLYRAGKYVRRHWIGVAAAAAVALAVAGGAVAERRQAAIARSQAQRVRELANSFLFEYYDQVAALPGSTAVRAAMVEKASNYLDSLAREGGDDPGLLVDLAKAFHRLAEAQGSDSGPSLGRREDSRRSLARSVELFRRVAAGRSPSPGAREAFAEALVSMSSNEHSAGHGDEAAAPAAEAVAVLDGLDTPAALVVLARAHQARGRALLLSGYGRAALEALGASRLALERAGADSRQLVTADAGIARAKARVGDLDAAAAELDDAVGRLREAFERNRADRRTAREYAVTLSYAADVYGAPDRPNLGEVAKARERYLASIRVYESLAAADPNDRTARYELAMRLAKLGEAIAATDPRGALAATERAQSISWELQSPEQRDLTRRTLLGAAARAHLAIPNFAQASLLLDELGALIQRDLREHPADFSLRKEWIECETHRGVVAAGQGRRSEAAGILSGAVVRSEELRRDFPGDFNAVFTAVGVHQAIANLGGAGAPAALERARALMSAWPATSFTKRYAAGIGTTGITAARR
jgi:hypothetical protein